MALPLRQSVSVMDSPGDWIRVEDAAALTGESVRTWRHKALWEGKTARQQSRRSLARKGSTASGRGRLGWYVHRGLDKRLTCCPTTDTRENRQRQALILQYPQHKVEAAWTKAEWLRRWRELCNDRRGSNVTAEKLAERIVAQAREVEGPEFRISFRALQLWKQAYDALGEDGQIGSVEALIDHRGDRPAGGGAHEARSPEAVAYFYSLYHCQNRLSVKRCHAMTVSRAAREGWKWPVTYAATCKWLDKTDDLALTCLFREGKQVWQHKYMPALESDYGAIQPGELYVCDHHQCDFWVEHDGKHVRPWLTAIEDCRSRVIVGWHLGVAAHQDSILAAMRRAFLGWAIPSRMRIDNGRDFTSKLLTGVTKEQRNRLRAELGSDWQRMMWRNDHLAECLDPRFKGIVNELGIKLIYARPYSPWSKGQLERWFGTFEGQCGKSFATYCGNSALTRPECLEDIRRGYTKEEKRSLRERYGRDWKRVAVLKFVDQSAVPTLAAAREVVGEWLEVYHRTEHRGEGMNGLSPQAVWNTAASLRRADEQSLTLLTESRGIYKVGRNGVAFIVGNYKLTYGAGCTQLYRYNGREVFITLDPDDLSHCHAWTVEPRSYIGRLGSNERISPLAKIEDLRPAIAAVEGRRKVGRKAAREAAMRMRTVAQEMRAQQRERLQALQATGTDDHKPNIEIVRTGFEGVLKPVQTGGFCPPRMPSADAVADLLPDEDQDQPGRNYMPRDVSDFLPDEEHDQAGGGWTPRDVSCLLPDKDDDMLPGSPFAAFLADKDDGGDASNQDPKPAITLGDLSIHNMLIRLEAEGRLLGSLPSGMEADLSTPDPSGSLTESRRE